MLGIFFLVTIFAGAVLSNVKLAGSMAELFLGDSPRFQRYQERVKGFGSDRLIIIAFEEESLFSKPSIEKLKRVVPKIENLSRVRNVKSILDLQDVQVAGGMPSANHYVDMAMKQPERSGKILDKVRSDPFISGLWISKDGRHSMVIIEPEFSEIHSDQDLPPLIEEILKITKDGGSTLPNSTRPVISRSSSKC